MSVRVRFAPSPTGSLHMGGARTALFNYLFAKKHQGQFILRIEDTDQERHQEESIQSLLETLGKLGLDWDEGLYFKNNQWSSQGNYGPYRQSERLSLYQEQIQKLLDQGQAYYCFLKEEEIQKMREEAKLRKKPFQLFSPYRDHSRKESEKKIQQGEPACIRFKTPDTKKNYLVKDLVRGEITLPSDGAGDFILIRSDNNPVYNFSCAVDDALMKISHVFRAEEHLPNTLKQILIQETLGFTPPQIGHLSLILGKDKKKMSKREGTKSTEDFLNEGFLPSSLNNFLALLGWNPKTTKEYFSKEELIEAFSIKGLNASPAFFDEEKILWLNGEHLKNTSNQELWNLLKPFLQEESLTFLEDSSWRNRLMETLKSGFKTLKQARDLLRPFANEGFKLDSSCLPILKWPRSRSLIESWKETLSHLPDEELNEDIFKTLQKKLSSELNLKGKELFMPLRCALLGKPEGAEIKMLVSFLKKKELIRRACLVLKSYENF